MLHRLIAEYNLQLLETLIWIIHIREKNISQLKYTEVELSNVIFWNLWILVLEYITSIQLYGNRIINLDTIDRFDFWETQAWSAFGRRFFNIRIIKLLGKLATIFFVREIRSTLSNQKLITKFAFSVLQVGASILAIKPYREWDVNAIAETVSPALAAY